MMLRCVVAVLLLTALFAPAPVSAQDVPVYACTDDEAAELASAFSGLLEAFNNDMAVDDSPAALVGALDTLIAGASLTRAACEGMMFTGEEPRIIGPLTFEPGIYRIRMISGSGFFILSPTTVSGDCGSDRAITTSAATGAGAEALYQPPGECTALFEISNVRDGWLLSFERLDTGADAPAKVGASTTPAPK